MQILLLKQITMMIILEKVKVKMIVLYFKHKITNFRWGIYEKNHRSNRFKK